MRDSGSRKRDVYEGLYVPDVYEGGSEMLDPIADNKLAFPYGYGGPGWVGLCRYGFFFESRFMILILCIFYLSIYVFYYIRNYGVYMPNPKRIVNLFHNLSLGLLVIASHSLFSWPLKQRRVIAYD